MGRLLQERTRGSRHDTEHDTERDKHHGTITFQGAGTIRHRIRRTRRRPHLRRRRPQAVPRHRIRARILQRRALRRAHPPEGAPPPDGRRRQAARPPRLQAPPAHGTAGRRRRHRIRAFLPRIPAPVRDGHRAREGQAARQVVRLPELGHTPAMPSTAQQAPAKPGTVTVYEDTSWERMWASETSRLLTYARPWLTLGILWPAAWISHQLDRKS